MAQLSICDSSGEAEPARERERGRKGESERARARECVRENTRVSECVSKRGRGGLGLREGGSEDTTPS